MGLLEMLARRVAWVYFVLVVPILVLCNMMLLIRAVLNQVPVVRASNDRPRFEIGSSSRVRNSPETPATQTDLAAVLDDPELHGRARAGEEQINSLPPVIEEPKCTICQESMRADGDVKTLACRHEFHVECIDEWLDKNTTCPNCRATIQIVPI